MIHLVSGVEFQTFNLSNLSSDKHSPLNTFLVEGQSVRPDWALFYKSWQQIYLQTVTPYI